MEIQAYKINKDGFVIDVVVVNNNDINLDDNIIVEQMTNGFYKPRWVNSEWIEGATQEYIESITNTPTEPSQDDYLLDLEMRVTLLELGLTSNLKGE